MNSSHSDESSGVSIVIPVHNEREAITETLREINRVMSAHGGEWEMIVVDDRSSDGSVEVIEALALGRLTLLRHEATQGYGAALKSGFAAARHAFVAFLDGDGTYPPAELPRLLDAARGADMVVGEREGYRDHSSWARRLGQGILVPLAKYLTGCKIPDLNSGMRVVRRDMIERYWPLLPDGFSLTTTLTMALLSARRRVAYVPIRFRSRIGRSKIQPLRDMSNFLALILRTVTYFNPLKVYLPLSVLLVMASVAVVLVSKYVYGRVMDVTALFLFIAGLQMLLVGVIADLVLKLLGTRKFR